MNETHRRQFVLGSVAALTSSQLLKAQEREIRTAFVGIGVRGTALVTQVLQQPGVKVTAVCDIDPKARDHAQGMLRGDNPPSFPAFRQVLYANAGIAEMGAAPD